MRILKQNEFTQIGGGIQNLGTSDESRIFIIGAGIGAITSVTLFEARIQGILFSALVGGLVTSVFMNPESLPKASKI